MPALAWVKAVHIAATALLAGVFAFDILVLRRGALPGDDAAPAPALRASLRGVAIGALGVGALSWLAWLALLAIDMSGQAPAEALRPGVLGTVLGRTTFGHVWIWRAGLLLALAIVLRRRRVLSAWAGAGLALPLVCGLAWAGHAAGGPPLQGLLDAVHLLAASVWLGMLLPLWLVIRRAATSEDPAWLAVAAASARLFSLPGMVAVATLALTGLANAAWQLEAPGELITTAYGQVLLAKLAAFALMLVLAGANRLRFTPAAQVGAPDRGRALRHLRASVLLEVALGALILACVGWLGVTAPGAHDEHAHHMHET